MDDVIVNYSTGAIGVPIEKRIAYLRELRPDVAALNMSSMNYAKYSARRKDFVFKAVFENSFDTIIEFLEAMNELGIRPEHECFDSGHVANLDPLIDMGLLSEPLQIACVMGVNGGIRPTPRNLAHMADQIPGGAEGRNNWGVIGISRDQWRLVAAAAALGGNVRVGLEDNFYLPDGEMARSNGDLIARARRIVEDVGRRAATVAEARELLGAAAAGRRRERVCSEGIKVLDLSRLLPGGFCSLLLADFGAEVLKVEDTGMGDYVRWSPPYHEGADDSAKSALFLVAQPRQALDPAQPQGGGRPRGAAAAGARVRRAARVVSARGDGAPRGRLRAPARGEPAARLLRDHRLRPGRPVHGALRARHELPRAERAARADRRRGRAAGAVRRPDRRPRRRRADGRVRDPRRAARARAQRRGPARGRVDVRRLAVLAGDGGGRATWRRRARRSAASSSWPGALICYRPYACSDGWVTLGALEPKFWQAWCRGVGREDLIEKQFERPGSEAHAEVERIFLERTRDEWQAFAVAARLLPRAGARPRRGARLGARAGARDGRADRPAGHRRREPAGRAGQAVAHAGRAGRPGPGAGRAHARGAGRARLRDEEIARCSSRARRPGAAADAQGSFLA